MVKMSSTFVFAVFLGWACLGFGDRPQPQGLGTKG